MEMVDSYPVVVTDRLVECRDFYRRWFGFEVGFEADWFVLLSGGGRRADLARLHAPRASLLPALARRLLRRRRLHHLPGRGRERPSIDRLPGEGAEFELELRDEPWGQRRFGITDPAGMWVDVIEQIEPAAGWWDPYMVGKP